MNNPNSQYDELRDAYDAFSVDHDSQRNELMKLIAEEPRVV